MMLFRFSILVAFAGMTVSAPAWAQPADGCSVTRVTVQPGTVLVGYDPFAAGITYGDFSVQIEASDCPPNRNLFAEFEPVVANQLAGGELTLTGADGSALRAIVVDDRGSDARGMAQFFNVTAGNQPFALAIAQGQVVVPGEYRVSMSTLVRPNNGRNTQAVTGVFEIIVRVGAAIGLAPANGTALNLGEMRDGGRAAVAATFDAYANVPYRLQVRSDNGFVLKLGNASGVTGPAYRALLDVAPLDSGLARRDFDQPPSGIWRRRHSLDAQVETIAGYPAGSYGDYLTVEIGVLLGQ